MRYMPRRTLCALSAIIVLCLAGCTGPFASVTPTPTSVPTATVVILSPQQTPQVTCSDAVHLIQQLQVYKVVIYTDDSNELVDIDVFVTYAPTSAASSVPDLVPPGKKYINPLTGQCEAQVLAAVKQANKHLPPNAQIQVEQLKTYD